jgi:hypothetical protein
VAGIRRVLEIAWEVMVGIAVGTGVTALMFGIFVLIFIGVPLLGFAIFARLNTTTVEWPSPNVVAMREVAERQFPPPPASSFDSASITVYYDGDKWKCVRYKTDASAHQTRTYYEGIFQEMQWGVSDGHGRDGPYVWQLSVIAMNGTVRLTPWNEGVSVDRAPPPYRVAVCFAYESWLWRK